jgi:hypothetical protein
MLPGAAILWVKSQLPTPKNISRQYKLVGAKPLKKPSILLLSRLYLGKITSQLQKTLQEIKPYSIITNDDR